MTRSSTISSKGQITVPLELKQGDRVEFVIESDRTTIRPARGPENPFVKYVGALPVFSRLHDVNAWVRTQQRAIDTNVLSALWSKEALGLDG